MALLSVVIFVYLVGKASITLSQPVPLSSQVPHSFSDSTPHHNQLRHQNIHSRMGSFLLLPKHILNP
jgi:hypothetical protein